MALEVWKLQYPYTGGITAEVVIDTVSSDLPTDVSPIINQTLVESVSGVVQASEQGDARETYSLVFSGLSEGEYNDVKKFLAAGVSGAWTDRNGVGQTGGSGYMLRKFKVVEVFAGITTVMRLMIPPQYSQAGGNKYNVVLQVAEAL